ncbi:PIN domain-containing protein [Desulfofundulus thermobenzoicus]|uniref:PIN domain-containing protein n=1 Tax=Desulfofundulus thermobenzoicus TaxID=29376 RepID=A0A6N7IPP0_9FIRM|nr:PIN domain-containing protein [Desulfofundulus thermobenzoicus]MQL51549.1 PIN domain-containing protein [Desulfofundulus thermobenzoicus]
MRQIFVDTSFWYAHAFAGDPHHKEAVAFLSRVPAPLITTNFIFDELVTILRYDFGHRVAVEYGKRLKESKICTLVRLLPTDEEHAWELFCKYSDQNFSFTDCTSFAFMQRLEIKEAAAFDVHFETAGFVRLPPVSLKKK